MEKHEAAGENGLEPFTDPEESLLLPQTGLLIPFSSDTPKTQSNTPSPATSYTNDLQSLPGCSGKRPVIVRAVTDTVLLILMIDINMLDAIFHSEVTVFCFII